MSLKAIHTWIGIVSGIFLSIIAVTGSVILFRAEFERASMPRGAASTHLASLDDAAREIIKLQPDALVRRVRLPAHEGDPYVFQIQSGDKKTERIVVEASSGRVLGKLETPVVNWLVDLHRNLLLGRQGRLAAGAIGIVLFALSATGLLMWLTGGRNWRAWISIRRRGSRLRFNYELHRAAGLWAYAFLALISFTGIELSYPDTFRQTVFSLTREPATVPAPTISVESKLSLDQYLRIGGSAMPDGVPVELRLPVPGTGPVDLRLYRSGDLTPSGNHVYINPASGAVIMIDRIVDRPIGARFLAAMSPIHYAQFGGMPAKIAWALLGLAPVLLFVTGFLTWRRPTKQKAGQTLPEKVAEEDLVHSA